MKLRNKKTGKIVERVYITIREEGVTFNSDETYESLAALNEEWEDYELTGSLIRDEKKRKIIRACASLDSVEDARVVKRYSDDTITFIFGSTTLTLRGLYKYECLCQCGTYTITELCGEENEQ